MIRMKFVEWLVIARFLVNGTGVRTSFELEKFAVNNFNFARCLHCFNIRHFSYGSRLTVSLLSLKFSTIWNIFALKTVNIKQISCSVKQKTHSIPGPLPLIHLEIFFIRIDALSHFHFNVKFHYQMSNCKESNLICFLMKLKTKQILMTRILNRNYRIEKIKSIEN